MAPIATDLTTENLLLKASLFAFDGAGTSDGGPAIHDEDGDGDGTGSADGEGLCGSGGETGRADGVWWWAAGGTEVGDGAGAGYDDSGVGLVSCDGVGGGGGLVMGVHLQGGEGEAGGVRDGAGDGTGEWAAAEKSSAAAKRALKTAEWGMVEKGLVCLRTWRVSGDGE